ncbi:MAG: Mov34/MPN/PAD-1 family protein [Ignavibacteriales bacterium]
MRLIVNERDLSVFKRWASRGYPREVYGIMLGKKLKNIYKVLKIVIPPIVESTYHYVIPNYIEIDKIIASSGLSYIGAIHSHPQAPPTLSPHDYQYWNGNDKVLGILSVRRRNAYKVTELMFWQKNSPLPVQFKTFNFKRANGFAKKIEKS